MKSYDILSIEDVILISFAVSSVQKKKIKRFK